MATDREIPGLDEIPDDRLEALVEFDRVLQDREALVEWVTSMAATLGLTVLGSEAAARRDAMRRQFRPHR